MRFVFDFKNKFKIAILLFAVMCCSLLIRFLEDKNIKNINESFVSMYNDRLIPATDLYEIGDMLHHKDNLFLETFIYNNGDRNVKKLLSEINNINIKIDSIIKKYESTYLVKQEATYLSELKSSIKVQHKVEQDVIREAIQSFERGKVVYEVSGKPSSNQSYEKLSQLIKIQTNVGNELFKNSKVFNTGTTIYSALQVVLAIMIGILIVLIITSTNSAKLQQNKYDLN